MKQRKFFYYDKLDSTMQAYIRLKEDHTGLLCVRAGTQKDGKGRDENIWLSPEDGLWFTFDVKTNVLNPSFALYIGYCVHRELITLFAPLEEKLTIKWPNDIIYDGKKVCGILCKSRAGHYVVGIGLNSNNNIDEKLGKFGAINLKNILGFEVSNEKLCRNIVAAVDRYDRLLSHPISYITYCNENLFGKNHIARIDQYGDIYDAEILGIDLNGALIVRKESGETINIHSGSILEIKAFS